MTSEADIPQFFSIGAPVRTHGGLATAVFTANESIAGPAACICVGSFNWDNGIANAGDEKGKAIAELAVLSGVLVGTEMFGSTPLTIVSRSSRPSASRLLMMIACGCWSNCRTHRVCSTQRLLGRYIRGHKSV